MTVKEIAEFLKRNERTIQRWVKSLADKMSSVANKMSEATPLKPIDFTLNKTIEIMRIGKVSDGIISILKENAK